MLQTLKMQLKEAEQNFSCKKFELDATREEISRGVDTVKTPSFIFSEMSFYSGQINALKSVITLLEGEEELTCVICESKSDFKLSDEGFCAPCFDAEEEEQRLQEQVNA